MQESTSTSSRRRGMIQVVEPADATELLRLRREHQWDIAEHAQWRDGVWHTDLKCQVHFPDSVHDELFALEDRSFWFQHRNRVISKALRVAVSPAGIWRSARETVAWLIICSSRGCKSSPSNRYPPAPQTRAATRNRNVVCGRFESLQLPSIADSCG